jgi:uncharacterized protein with GYD domain
MAVYVTLYRYTDEGMKRIKDAAEVARGWEQAARDRGVTVQALYWLQGAYDAVTIVESDDEDAVNGLLLSIGSQGLMRTETLRGFGLDDVERFTQRVGG